MSLGEQTILIVFAILLGVCICSGSWLATRLSHWLPFERVMAAALPSLVLITLFQSFCSFSALFFEPACAWSGNRLTPAFAITHGLGLYHGPSSGPVTGMIYGPLMALIYLPATLASTPSGALFLGGIVSVVIFFVPILWLHIGRHRRDPKSLIVATTGFVCFVLLSLESLPLRSGFAIHADAPAVGLAGGFLCGALRWPVQADIRSVAIGHADRYGFLDKATGCFLDCRHGVLCPPGRW